MFVFQAQANARAALLKEQLERKRREAYEREKKAWDDHLAAKGLKNSNGSSRMPAAALGSPSHGQQSPGGSPARHSKSSTPSISMTSALRDVGALKDSPPTGVAVEEFKKAELSVHNEKREILRRLNQNLKSQDNEVKDQNEQNKSVADQPLERKEEQYEDKPIHAVDRKKWEEGASPVIPLAQLTMEETTFLDTGNPASAVTLGLVVEEPQRRVWMKSPAESILKVLGEAELQCQTEMLLICTEVHSGIHQNLPLVGDENAIRNNSELEKSFEEAVVNNADVIDGTGTSEPPLGVPIDSVQDHESEGYEEESKSVFDLGNESGAVSPKTNGLKADSNQAELENIQVGLTVQASELPLVISSPSEKEIVLEVEELDDLETEILEDNKVSNNNGCPIRVTNVWGNELKAASPKDGAVTPAGDQESQKEPLQHKLKTESQPCDAWPQEPPCFYKVDMPQGQEAEIPIMSIPTWVGDGVPSRSRSEPPVKPKSKCSLLIGLSTGLFDANNPKMLRTCSLPDLSKLFRTFVDGVSGVTDGQEEDNLEVEDIEDEPLKGEDHSDSEDTMFGETDRDLRELQASMEQLLREQPSEEYIEHEETGAGEGPHEEEMEPIPTNNGEVENEEEEEENLPSSESALNEDWQSDDSDGDATSQCDDGDSLFCHLEELRFNLEQEIGFDKFIEVYTKIKAIHEDEDENIDICSSIVENILGSEHHHLYPKILHLVMADGAYQEDNDE